MQTKQNKSKLIYSLTLDDVLQVMDNEDVQIKLNQKHIQFLKETVAKYIDWEQAISCALSDLSETKSNESI